MEERPAQGRPFSREGPRALPEAGFRPWCSRASLRARAFSTSRAWQYRPRCRRRWSRSPCLEVFDLVDAAVLADKIFLRVVARHTILEFVGDDADVIEAGVFDCDRKR